MSPLPTDPSDDPGTGGSTAQFDSEAPPGDYMEGYEPTGAGSDSLKTALNTHLSKSSVHIPSPTQIPAAGEGPYSAGATRSLEDAHRTHYTRAESDTRWAHFLVVDGKYTSENVVGIAYQNTSMAFFGQTIGNLFGELSTACDFVDLVQPGTTRSLCSQRRTASALAWEPPTAVGVVWAPFVHVAHFVSASHPSRKQVLIPSTKVNCTLLARDEPRLREETDDDSIHESFRDTRSLRSQRPEPEA